MLEGTPDPTDTLESRLLHVRLRRHSIDKSKPSRSAMRTRLAPPFDAGSQSDFVMSWKVSVVADLRPEIPPVCFDDDLCRILDLKQRTLQKRRAQHIFPIPELLPRLDKRRRYGRADVIRFLEREDGGPVMVPVRRRSA